MVEIGRYREVSLPERFAGATLPEIRAIDLTQDPPPRGRWLAPSLVARARGQPRARRAVAAVPQPPRLRAADPVPPLRPPLPMPQLHRLDGRAPADAPPRLPPLRPCHAAAQGLPRMRRGGQPRRLRPRRRADRRRGRRAVSRRAHRDRHLGHHLVAARAPPSSSRAMEAGEIDIVVGTQLVTKGYHFPNLTLVGVVDADLGLQGGDLRAAERSFQQIQQVAGRAGRGDKPGRVLVQTHDPDAPVIAALVSGDAPASTPPRPKPGARPPCRRSAAWPRSSFPPRMRPKPKPSPAASAMPRPTVDGMAVFGPAPAPLAMLRGRHRQRLLVHAAPQPRRPGRHPRLARRARLERQGPRRGRRRSLQLPLDQQRLIVRSLRSSPAKEFRLVSTV